jgi:serine/threonine protein kinase
LHLCGVVHRDLKPENLMFDAFNRLKLCDFGLAAEKIGQFVKTRSNLAGTPRYMAPEAFKNEPCSEKLDIFALGMILWEMYTGRLPWAGRSFSDVRTCVSNGTERPAIPSSAPPELARLICGIRTFSILVLSCHTIDSNFCQTAGRMIHRIVPMLLLYFLDLLYVPYHGR